MADFVFDFLVYLSSDFDFAAVVEIDFVLFDFVVDLLTFFEIFTSISSKSKTAFINYVIYDSEEREIVRLCQIR